MKAIATDAPIDDNAFKPYVVSFQIDTKEMNKMLQYFFGLNISIPSIVEKNMGIDGANTYELAREFMEAIRTNLRVS
jgi:hypothetical protein